MAESENPRLRLNPERETAILDAVRALISEVGYDAMRIDQVAARAHASKATIYRRWTGKADLATAVLHRMNPRPPEHGSTGDLRADLIRVMHDHVGSKHHDEAFLAGIHPAFQRDDELRGMVREQLVKPFRDAVHQALTWAVERGELSPGLLENRLLPETLPAMCMRRKWLDVDQSDEDFYVELIDTLVLPLLRGLDQPVATTSG
ncbi:TetR/AcrR family transcriptional regulator [Phytomonospora endophytica]|uniref:AcrR family transcriptional regulator n=1 Tax=Phytomonospora endophytica TaxID=714109 RepID=A0A841G210_9ACTN|nr:TetR/AcrR family transcriptional regulator [Phytomonospora endophytica]MBB6039687.1 AcrR family transcriptional regulator [Phytomonospora endophytica]GIG65594.1 TetR family transcriptional regulator [Phytomonospora endophytica]